MKLGLVSYGFKNKDVDFNIKQIEKAILSSKGVDMLCFGECFLQGFDCLSWKYELDKHIAIEQDSKQMKEILCLCQKYHTDLAFGYIEKDNNALYSSYAIVVDGKLVYNYRRISKGWKDILYTDFHYQEGLESLNFIYKNRKIRVALCGDLWEEEIKDEFISEDILLWPVYVNYSLEEWEKEMEEYVNQASIFSSNVLMINSLSSNPKSYGGAFYIHNGKLERATTLGQEEILVISL